MPLEHPRRSWWTGPELDLFLWFQFCSYTSRLQLVNGQFHSFVYEVSPVVVGTCVQFFYLPTMFVVRCLLAGLGLSPRIATDFIAAPNPVPVAINEVRQGVWHWLVYVVGALFTRPSEATVYCAFSFSLDDNSLNRASFTSLPSDELQFHYFSFECFRQRLCSRLCTHTALL